MKLYIHGTKERALDAGASAGLSEHALEGFKWAGHEVLLEYEVDEVSGDFYLYAVDGRVLGEKK